MKKLLLALFVMCSALSFSAKVIKANNAEVRENNIVYEAGQNAPYTGFIETYNEKNVLLARSEFKMVYKMVAQKYIFQMVNYIVKPLSKMGNKLEFKKITMKMVK